MGPTYTRGLGILLPHGCPGLGLMMKGANGVGSEEGMPTHTTHLDFVCLLDFKGHLCRVARGSAALPQTLGLPLGLTTLGLQLAQLPGRVHQSLQLQVDGAAVRGQGHSTALWRGSPQGQDSHHARAG